MKRFRLSPSTFCFPSRLSSQPPSFAPKGLELCLPASKVDRDEVFKSGPRALFSSSQWLSLPFISPLVNLATFFLARKRYALLFRASWSGLGPGCNNLLPFFLMSHPVSRYIPSPCFALAAVPLIPAAGCPSRLRRWRRRKQDLHFSPSHSRSILPLCEGQAPSPFFFFTGEFPPTFPLRIHFLPKPSGFTGVCFFFLFPRDASFQIWRAHLSSFRW